MLVNPSAIIPHIISMDAPPVTSKRTTGGKGRSFEGLPAQKARKSRSASAKHARGRKKDMVSRAIFLPDTPVLPALLPPGRWVFLIFIVRDM